jgi:hypothetical protein
VSTYAHLGPHIEVRYAIAALGECLVYTLHHACYAADLLVSVDPDVLSSWAMTLISADLPLWNDMIRVGWCPGALLRFRQVFNRMYPLHYASRIRLASNRRRWNHSNCTEKGCVGAQIRQGEYQLTHARHGCTCALASVDARESTRILQSAEGAFPVLNLTPLVGSSEHVNVVVENWKPDVPFIALSHVSILRAAFTTSSRQVTEHISRSGLTAWEILPRMRCIRVNSIASMGSHSTFGRASNRATVPRTVCGSILSVCLLEDQDMQSLSPEWRTSTSERPTCWCSIRAYRV